jgi:Zn finger protein HypA/HybF involved in hydrogenase expression
MDRLLRAAIERRQLETAVLSIEGDPAALLRCLGCGARLQSEDPRLLRCTHCVSSQRPTPERRAEWDAFVETRRALLERVSAQVEQLQLKHEVEMADEFRRCIQCSKKLRSDNRHETCSKCRHLRAKPAPEPERVVPPPAPITPTAPAKVERVRDPIEERFKLLTAGLGYDGRELLVDFMRSWVKRVEDAVAERITLPSPARVLEGVAEP